MLSINGIQMDQTGHNLLHMVSCVVRDTLLRDSCSAFFP